MRSETDLWGRALALILGGRGRAESHGRSHVDGREKNPVPVLSMCRVAALAAALFCVSTTAAAEDSGTPPSTSSPLMKAFLLALLSSVLALAVSAAEFDVGGGLSRSSMGAGEPAGRSVAAKVGHYSKLDAVAFSPDGRYLVSGGQDRAVKVWDVRTGGEVRAFSRHFGFITALSFSLEGSLCLSSSADGTVRLWEVETGREVRVFSTPGIGIRHAVLSADGAFVLSGGDDGVATLWDTKTGAAVTNFPSGGSIWRVALSADNRLALTADAEWGVRLWDVSTGRVLRTLALCRAQSSVLAFSPEGDLAIASGAPQGLAVWKVATGEKVREFSVVSPLAASRDGTRLLSDNFRGGLVLWDASAGTQLALFPRTFSSVHAAAFSPDGRMVATGNSTGEVAVREASTGRVLWTGGQSIQLISSAAFVGNSGRLVTIGPGKPCALWDLVEGTVLGQPAGTALGGQASGALSPEGTRLLLGNSSGQFQLRETESGTVQKEFKGKSPSGVSLSAGGKMALVASDSSVWLWDLRTGESARDLGKSSRPATAQAFSPDGSLVAVGFEDGRLVIWDAEKEEPSSTIVTGDLVSSIAFSPSGRHVVSGGGKKGFIRGWEVGNGSEVFRFAGHSWAVRALALSADGRHVLSGGSDKVVRLLDAATGELVRAFAGCSFPVTSVGFSPGGEYVFACDGTLHVWKLATGEEVAQAVEFGGGEWVFVTPGGRYRSSARGSEYLFELRPEGARPL